MVRTDLFLRTLLTIAAACMITGTPAEANDSNPGAYHTLFLDFGEFESSDAWPYLEGQGHPLRTGRPITSPEVFYAGAPENYTAAEQADYIRDVWRRVAEDFAPFDVNVTTTAPANLDTLINAGKALRVAIGGTINDIGPSGGVTKGYAYLSPIHENVAFATGRGVNQTLRPAGSLASTIAHEAAHAYGADYHYEPTDYYCTAASNDGLNNTHLTDMPGTYRDKWWTGLGLGYDITQNSTCELRGDVGVLWRAIGRRAPLSPANSTNPLSESAPYLLTGQGIVTINSATHNVEQWINFLNGADGCTTTVCEFNPAPLGYTIGKGPNEWIFLATPGEISIKVNTINNGYLDRATNLDADFQLWVEGSGSVPWIQLRATADRQHPDGLSGELSYTIPSTVGEKKYVVSVRSREQYGDLGGYTIEVEGINDNVREYVETVMLTKPTFPTPPILTSKEPPPTISVDPKFEERIIAPEPFLVQPVLVNDDTSAVDTVSIAR